MPIAQVLQRFVDDELDRTPALVERVLAGLQQLLRDGKDNPLAPSERGYQFALVEALQTFGPAYRNAFIKSVDSGVHEALLAHAERGAGGPTALPDDLELMDESRIDVDIEISRAMQLIDATAEWELRELQMFTSTLVGQKHVSPESNPFRPQVYAAALWQAACAASPLQVHRVILLRVSSGVVAGLLKSGWAAACTRLENQGVRPGVYRTVLLPAASGTGHRQSAMADASAAGAIGRLLASMPDGRPVTDQPIRPATGASMRSSARSEGIPMSTPEFERLIGQLDDMLRQLSTTPQLPEVLAHSGLGAQRAALVSTASSPHERQIIELLARVFDTMLSDPYIAAPFINVLARLQSSMLRVGLREPEMFDSVLHPVWLFVDRIGEAAAGYPQLNDPRALALLDICHALIDRITAVAEPDGEVYQRALTQLDHFLANQRQDQLESADAAVASLQSAEQRELLDQRLQQRLVEQMVSVDTSVTLRRFMTVAWAKVIAEAMLTHGEQGDETRGFIKLVDELLWSLQLPDHPKSRQRLLALLPDMLRRLRAGMASIEMPASEQQVLLDELMSVHTDALRKPEARGEATLTPHQIIKRMRDEVLPAATGRGGFSDSVIDLASMETVPAALLSSESHRASDDPVERVASLRRGQRLRLFLRGRWSRVQLLWRSDQGMCLLFAGDAHGHTHSITRRALERLAGAGLMQPVEERALTQRTFDAVTRALTLLH